MYNTGLVKLVLQRLEYTPQTYNFKFISRVTVKVWITNFVHAIFVYEFTHSW